jgi:hypothetical protein
MNTSRISDSRLYPGLLSSLSYTIEITCEDLLDVPSAPERLLRASVFRHFSPKMRIVLSSLGPSIPGASPSRISFRPSRADHV